MSERKKPGPHPEKPLEHDIKVRVDNETLAEIEYCQGQLKTTRSEVMRQGIHKLYDDLKN